MDECGTYGVEFARNSYPQLRPEKVGEFVMSDHDSIFSAICRRTFLSRNTVSVGAAALSMVLRPEQLVAGTSEANRSRGVVHPLHFPAKAKRVIFLCQAGGRRCLDTIPSPPK